MEFLIGTIVALLGVGVAWATLRWQLRGTGFKRVHYTAACNQLLLDRGDDAFDSFATGPISVHLEPTSYKLIWPMAFKLKLANTGRAPILPSDFTSTFNITFGPHCEFLGGSMAVNRGRADEYFTSDSATLENGCLRLSPFLLNPGDEITIAGILNGLPPEEGIALSGRLAGMDTFIRLQPRVQGPTGDLVMSSLVHDDLKHQPISPPVDVKIFALPKFLPFDELGSAPKNGRGISTRLNGAAVERMHQVSFHVTNYGRREIDLNRWLRCEAAPGTFLHLLEARKAQTAFGGEARSEFVEWDSQSVAVRPGPLGPNESFSATFITEGALADVEIRSRPEVMQDVQIARMTFPDASLDAQLSAMSPRVILTSPGLYRGFQKVRDLTTNLLPR